MCETGVQVSRHRVGPGRGPPKSESVIRAGSYCLTDSRWQSDS